MVDEKPTTRFLTPAIAKRNLALQESTLMVRRPYVEAVQYLKQIDWPQQDNLRLLLWGRLGTGKSITMCQISHFALKSDFIVLNFQDISGMLKVCRLAEPSEHNPEKINFPHEAHKFLEIFKYYNGQKLDGLVTSKAYKWSET